MTAALATWIFAAAWKGTLLVAFVLLVQRFARNLMPSRWLCALLLVAIVRLLAPVTPSASFSVFNLVPAAVPSPMIISSGVASFRPPPPPQAEAPRSTKPKTDTSPLLALWAAGAAFVVLRTARRMFLFHRQLADSKDVDRDDVLTLLDECRSRLGIRRSVRVATTSAVVTPSLHGWLRPALLLPQGFLHSFTLEQLRYVVLHELAHLRRSDVLINWIATAARAVHWFNPLVHLAVARLAEERELACDAVALAALRAEERPAYGGTVLEIVDRLRHVPAVPAIVGMTATPQQLKRRIVMIASFRRQSRHSILFAALVAAVGLVTLTDARAGEMRIRRSEMLSPAAEGVMQRLEQNVNMEFVAAPLEDILNDLSNKTGTSIIVTEGAIDDATRQSRVNLKGVDVPAHLVLFETLHTLGLGARFTDAGVEVIEADPADGTKVKVSLSRMPAGEGDNVIILRDGARLEVDETAHFVHQKMQVTDTTPEGAANRRTLRFRTSESGPEGTLEISIQK